MALVSGSGKFRKIYFLFSLEIAFFIVRLSKPSSFNLYTQFVPKVLYRGLLWNMTMMGRVLTIRQAGETCYLNAFQRCVRFMNRVVCGEAICL